MKLSNDSTVALLDVNKIKRCEEKYIRDHMVRMVLELLLDDDKDFVDTLIHRPPMILENQFR